MSNNILFSIITIVKNDKENIEKTILSVIHQKVPRMEYIVIDGGSTDGTLDIIEKYRDQIDIVVSEKDNGIADAFNKGIKRASGEIVGLVNAGDFLEENALQMVLDAFQEEPADIVYGDLQYWGEDGKEYVYRADHTLLPKFMSLNHPAVFVRKELYDRYGLFDENYRLAMDYEILLRFYHNNARFKYLEHTLSHMPLGGISDVNWKRTYGESCRVRKKYLGESPGLSLSCRWQMLKRYISNLVSHLGLESVKKFYRRHFSAIKKEKS